MSRWKSALYTLGLAAGLLLFAVQIVRGARSVLETGALPSLPALALAQALMLVLLGLQMWTWQTVMVGLGARLSYREAARGYPLSFIPRYIPGSVWGYLSRGEWLHRGYGVSYSVANLGSIVDILVTLTSSGMVIGLYGLLAEPQPALRLGGLALLAGLPWAVYAAQRAAPRLPFLARWRQRFSLDTLEGITLPVWWRCLGIFCLQWLLLGAITLILIAAAAPESVPALTAGGLLKATFAFSLAWTAGFLILLVPGGLGVRELALSGLLVSLFGLTPAAGALAAILTRLIYSLAEAGWILYGLAASRLAPLAPAGTRKEG